jgi:hypothetical protein
VPEIQFIFDESVEQHERIERLIQEIHETDAARARAPEHNDEDRETE